VVGELLPEIAREVDIAPLPVIASASHDTASAVAAVPARGDKWAFLSSGTWSLLGMELPHPVINEKTLKYNLTNEGGVEGTFRLLKNITGLWLVQECRRTWEKEGESLSYDELTRMAAEAEPFQAFIDPDDEIFLNPADMPVEISKFYRKTAQSLPEDKGSIIRSILESLALKYRLILEQLQELSGRRIETLHIIGGGTRNHLLCQFAADATGIPVIAGPVEATAIGNILMQTIARGDLSSLAEGREIVHRSFPLTTYRPENTTAWNENYHRFKTIIEKGVNSL
jgi:rhamnulokinase